MWSPERGLCLIHRFVYGRSIPARPMLDCDVQANGRSHLVLAMVDSGADDTIFPMYVARDLGLMPAGDSREMMRGLTGAVAPIYRWDVTLQFSFGSFRVRAGFCDALRIGILGQNGFFDQARVMFDRRSRLFTVDPY